MNKKMPRNSEIDRRARLNLPKARTDCNTPVALVIDGNNIAHMAKHSYRNLSYKGKSVSMIFGVPKMVGSYIQRHRPEKVIVCWDGDRHPERIKALPEYKSHRDKKKTPEDVARFHKQLDRVRRELRYLGIPQVYNRGMEGDDAIYWAVKSLAGLYKVVIISGDKDMHQMINYDVSVYCPRTNQPFTPFAFLVDHGCEIHQFVDYLCLTGDSSDDIPGYRGIGPVNAGKFLRAHDSIEKYLKNPKAEFSGVTDKEKLAEIYKRNRLMIDLKYFNEKYHSLKDLTYYKGKRSPAMKEELFTQFCIKYGLRTLMTDTFKQPFKKLHQ